MKTGNFVNFPDQDDSKKIAALIKDISDSKALIEGANAKIRDTKKALKDDYDMTAKSITKMISLYHQQNSQSYFEEQEELEELYTQLFPTKMDGSAAIDAA